MGFFDVHCGYSGLALIGDARLVVLQKKGRRWAPIAAPIVATYNRLGGVDEARKNAPFARWLMAATGESDFDEALRALAEGETRFNGSPISYALVDEGVYQAIKGGVTAASSELPAALRVGWKTALDTLKPIDFEDGDQYTGLIDEFGCAKRITRARKRFAGNAAMLKAIARNEAQWGARDEDDDEDDRNGLSSSEKRRKVLAVISEQTGIPVAQLGPERNLYTDLGIVPGSTEHEEIDSAFRGIRTDLGFKSFSKCATVGELLTAVDGGALPDNEGFVWAGLVKRAATNGQKRSVAKS